MTKLPTLDYRNPRPQFTNITKLTTSLATCLTICAFFALISLTLNILTALSPTLLDQIPLEALNLFAPVYLLILVATPIYFLIWMFKAHRNVSALTAAPLKHRHIAAVLWWFVPIANVFMPTRVMREIARHSQIKSDTKNSLEAQASWWWTYFITPILFTACVVIALSTWRFATDKFIEPAIVGWISLTTSIITNALNLLAALAAIILIKAIAKSQFKLSQSTPTTAPASQQHPFALLINGTLLPLLDSSPLHGSQIPSLDQNLVHQNFAQLTRHPLHRQLVGLKNLSTSTWKLTRRDGTNAQLATGQTVKLEPGATLHFGPLHATVVES